ncbi:Sodium/hydrogen exchanger, partial [Gryllus bimaculatus]
QQTCHDCSNAGPRAAQDPRAAAAAAAAAAAGVEERGRESWRTGLPSSRAWAMGSGLRWSAALALALATAALLVAPALASPSSSSRGRTSSARNSSAAPALGPANPVHHGIHVVSWRWEEIGAFFTLTAFVVITGLAKVAFHHASWLLMIVMGVSVGVITYFAGVRTENEESTFHFTLPNFSPQLFFMGTLWNTFAIGLALYGLYYAGTMGTMPTEFGLIDAMVFAALISGVDPVAVLAIFQEIGVNKDLYYLVFGESLFNDAVTVVLYTTMATFYEMPHIPNEQYLLATLAFFTVSLGGAVVGVIFGLISALITRTTVHCRVVEPLAVLGLAYASYLQAELFHFSGIISIIVCGLVQAHYALQNISPKSSTCDAIIFLFLGMELVSDHHVWHTGFVLWTLLLCLICRFVGVAILTAVANAYRIHRINFQEQFIMGYGGLRGAVAFSLAEMLDIQKVIPRQMFITTTLVVILFTVFIQGSTIKPLVKLLHIRLSKAGHKTLNEELNDHIISNMMAAIEEVTGYRGDFYMQKKFEHMDDIYLKRVFMNTQHENSFTRLYEKLLLADHYVHLYGPVALVEDNKGDVLRQPEPASPISNNRNSLPPQRLSLLFPGVELRHRQQSIPSSPTSRDPSVEGGAGIVTLRRAIRDNPYQKLHERYNPNLIADECQELQEHLERRHITARRITQLAAFQRLSAMSDPVASPQIGDEFQWPKRQIHSENMEGLDALLERAGQRGALRKTSFTGSSAGGDSTRGAPQSPVLGTEPHILFRQTSLLQNISETEDDALLPPKRKDNVMESSL